MSTSEDPNVTTAQEPEPEAEAEQEQEQQSEEWETMARAWLCSFPEAKEVSMAEVEAWIDSNLASLPEGLRSMPRPDLSNRLISFQNCIRLPNQVPTSSTFSSDFVSSNHTGGSFFSLSICYGV